MSKKGDAPELFEVFRSGIRSRRPDPGPDAAGKPVPDAEARAEVPMGERTVTLNYTTAAILLFFGLALLFVFFALGVRWGRDEAMKARAAAPPPARVAPPVEPRGDRPRPGLGPSVPAPPPAVAPAAAANPADFWTIRMIHYETRAEADAIVRGLAQAYPDLEPFVEKMVLRGRTYYAACFGRYARYEDAAADLEKVRSLPYPKASGRAQFGSADVQRVKK